MNSDLLLRIYELKKFQLIWKECQGLHYTKAEFYLFYFTQKAHIASAKNIQRLLFYIFSIKF